MAKPKSIETPAEQAAAATVGNRINEFLTDPAVTEVFAALRSDIIAAWRAGKTTEARETEWHRLKMLDDFDVEARKVVDTGILAGHILRRQS